MRWKIPNGIMVAEVVVLVLEVGLVHVLVDGLVNTDSLAASVVITDLQIDMAGLNVPPPLPL
jgi:hypothetical protein